MVPFFQLAELRHHYSRPLIAVSTWWQFSASLAATCSLSLLSLAVICAPSPWPSPPAPALRACPRLPPVPFPVPLSPSPWPSPSVSHCLPPWSSLRPSCFSPSCCLPLTGPGVCVHTNPTSLTLSWPSPPHCQVRAGVRPCHHHPPPAVTSSLSQVCSVCTPTPGPSPPFPSLALPPSPPCWQVRTGARPYHHHL